jgi:molybdate transport system permease protein
MRGRFGGKNGKRALTRRGANVQTAASSCFCKDSVSIPGLLDHFARPTPQEWEIILLTLRVAGLAVGGALPVALLFGWLLARRFPGRILINTAINLPLALPPVVTGWLLLVVFGVQGPAGAWLLRTFGVRLVFTSAGAALACGVMVFPIMVRTIRLGIEAVDPALGEAARTLGAGRLDRLFTVTLPLAAPGVLAACAFGFTASLGEFGAVITFAANIPGQTQTLPLAIYSALQSPGGEAVAARLSVCSVVLALVGLLISERLAGRFRR